MGQDLQKGTTYAEGGVGGIGTVNAANLNAHVDEARIKASFITSKSLKDPAALGDAFVVESEGVLYRETMQQLLDLIDESVKLPTGIIMDFAGTTLPAGWLFCFGQLVSRITYNLLFDIVGETYSAGDGSTTFGIPDLRGMVTAGKDDMGGVSADRLTSPLNGDTLGASGGTEGVILTTAQLPSHTHPVSVSGGGTFGGTVSLTGDHVFGGGGGGLSSGAAYSIGGVTWSGTSSTNVSFTSTGTATATGSGSSHSNLQPTRVLNKIIRYL